MGRALVGLVILATAACSATEHLAFTKPDSFVPWAPLAPTHQYVEAPPTSPVTPLPVPAGTPTCQASQLEGVGTMSEAATGNVNMPLLFRNRSPAACYLEGYVDVSILDRTGRELARGSGETGRGTFFADGPVTQVLMAPDTSRLPAFGTSNDGRVGQAYMNFSWYDCRELQAEQLAIGLPAGGGTFRMPYPTKPAWYPVCDSGGQYTSVQRGPLSPGGSQWPPPPDYIAVHVDLDSPAAATRGSDVTYYVTIENVSKKSFDMLPCADYAEMLDAKQAIQEFRLNCDGVRTIAPGQKTTFEMRMNLPAWTDKGSRQMCWYLIDGRIDNGNACAPLLIN